MLSCKRFKLKWLKYCVLSTAGNNKTNANPNILILILIVLLFSLSKTQNYMFLSSLYQQKIIKNYQNFLVMDLID